MKKNEDKTVLEYMYRYLEKFTGKYRVLPNYDLSTEDFPRDENNKIDESFEDLYIPCSKGKIIHTYVDFDVLAVYNKNSSVIKNLCKELKSKYPKMWMEQDITGSDGFLYFKAQDIGKVAKFVKPRTSGAKIKWYDKRNLPKKKYVIPEEDIKKLNDCFVNTKDINKMLFMKTCNSEFLDSIDKKLEAKQSGLSSKEYIHSVGKWDEYIDFVSNKIKSI